MFLIPVFGWFKAGSQGDKGRVKRLLCMLPVTLVLEDTHGSVLSVYPDAACI